MNRRSETCPKEAEPLLPLWLADVPWDMLQPLLDIAATNHVLISFSSYVGRIGKDSGRRSGSESCPFCGGSHVTLDNLKSVYGSIQRLNLHETPGSIPPGRVPCQKEVILAVALPPSTSLE
jgi:MCM OB domain